MTGRSLLNGGVDIKGDLNVGPDNLVVLNEVKHRSKIGGDCNIEGDLIVHGRSAFETAVLQLNKFEDPNTTWNYAGIEIFRGLESSSQKYYGARPIRSGLLV